jgi:predicted dinucleotide-binding enzyme
VIDPSNPIAPNEKGGFDKIIGENESAGLINAAILPNGAKLAKALGTLGMLHWQILPTNSLMLRCCLCYRRYQY